MGICTGCLKKTEFYQIEHLEILLPVGKKYFWQIYSSFFRHPAYILADMANTVSQQILRRQCCLGMNHDGETTEGNRCSPDQFLMSPVLGPGKV